MRVAVFSTHAFDRQFLDEANVDRAHDLYYLDARLTAPTSALARGCPAVCAFVNDQDAERETPAISRTRRCVIEVAADLLEKARRAVEILRGVMPECSKGNVVPALKNHHRASYEDTSTHSAD